MQIKINEGSNPKTLNFLELIFSCITNLNPQKNPIKQNSIDPNPKR